MAAAAVAPAAALAHALPVMTVTHLALLTQCIICLTRCCCYACSTTDVEAAAVIGAAALMCERAMFVAWRVQLWHAGMWEKAHCERITGDASAALRKPHLNRTSCMRQL
jgi:hypothetical protein